MLLVSSVTVWSHSSVDPTKLDSEYHEMQGYVILFAAIIEKQMTLTMIPTFINLISIYY